MFVQLSHQKVIVGGSSEITGIIHGTFLCHQVELFIQGFQSGSLRIRIRHVHNGSHSTRCCRTALGTNIRLMGKSRITEMDMVVNYAWKQVTSDCIDDFITRCRRFLFFHQYFRYFFSFYNYRTGHLQPFIHDDCIFYQGSFHDFPDSLLMVGYLRNQLFTFNFMTPNTASPNMLLFILEVPSSRLIKITGTSMILNPHL